MTARIPNNSETGWGNDFREYLLVSHDSSGRHPTYHDASRFGFVGDNSTDNSGAWTAMMNALDGEDTHCNVLFRNGIYVFASAINAAPAGVHFLRLTGMGGMPFFQQTPDGDMMCVFKYTNGSSSTFLDIDPGSGTLQSGVYIEGINFYNSGNAANTAISIDRTNNWRIERCGFQLWGTGIYSESNADNAHGKMRDCMMEIPAGKTGIEIKGGASDAGGGFSVDGGSYSGDTGSVFLLGQEYSEGMTLEGDVKIDGTTGGGVVWYGRHLHINGARFERACDSTHPAIDIKKSGGGPAGGGHDNLIALATIVGSGSELSGRFDTNSQGNAVSSMVVISNCTSGWVDNGSYNIKQQQLFDMPSSASYPVQLTDGSTLAQTIDVLQQSQLVKP